MSAEPRLKMVLCWHMHQPRYRKLISRHHYPPRAHLRAIEDYVDIAAHPEAVPTARAEANFAPLLLGRIDGDARHLRGRVMRPGQVG